jgi:hypothetical protein
MSYRNAWMLLFMAGCAGPAMQSRSAQPASSFVRLQVQTLAGAGPSADWQSLIPGGTLTSGSMFSVKVVVPSPLYVSLWQRQGDGSTAQLYPQQPAPSTDNLEAGVPAEPARAAHLPSPGKWFALDERVGEERLFVLASVQKLTLESARKLVSDRGEPSCERNREPPAELKERDRGETVFGPLDPDGIAILCFPFSHRPK